MSLQHPTVVRAVLGIDDEIARDAGLAGHKAANLARLTALGFPVPPGVVVSTDAVDRIRAQGAVPEDLAARLALALEDLGGGPVAVRSSGAAEDLPGASFAGQYETILGVDGVDAVAEAVLRCVRSAGAQRVAAYAAGRVGDTGLAGSRMAVLIQAMVQAEAAGVAFTADPVTGDRDEVLVSAIRGLGERLVGGEATPEEWRVRDGQARRVAGPLGAIDAADAARVGALAAAVEAAFGQPQDVEWAIAAGRLLLLQARPITALPRPPELIAPAEGSWEKDEEHYPMPLTPFGASVYLPAVEHGLAAMLETWGLPMERVLQRSVGGEIYTRAVPLGGKDRTPPPWWVIWLAMRVAPPLRRRTKRTDRALGERLPERLITEWPESREQFRRAAAALHAVDLQALTDQQLLAHLDRVLALLRRGEVAHFVLVPPYGLAVYELATACQELLGWTPTETLALLTGNSEASSEPGRALRDLAASLAASPAAVGALQGAGEDLLERLQAAAPQLATLVQAYLEGYGHRTFSYDPGDPTLAERPALLAALLRARIAEDPTRPDPAAAARTAALARARRELGGRPVEQRTRFEQALATAERAYGVREDNVVWTDNLPSGLLRYVAVEVGRRLVDRGLVARPDDAVFLADAELRAALLGVSADLRGPVAQRRAERAWVAAHPGPSSYGRPSPPPSDLRGLPTGLRQVSAAMLMLWNLGLRTTPARAEGDGSVITGLAGSPGRHTGTVRVIRDESQFGRLGPGEVLVCPTTSPAWSVLFTQAGALVTDGGGLLAHAAVIAREYGIPAVLATGDATRRLRDGDPVTVDGTAGEVHLAADGPR
jgi:phosphohistidine swiveling domain-containing protein